MNDKLKKTLKITKIRETADINNGVCVAVGMFDGVHLGHRLMLDSLVNESKRLGLPSAIFTFSASDNPKSDSKLITLSDKKIELFSELGIDVVFSADFSEIKTISAIDFTESVLYNAIGARVVVCGYDFRFGKDRMGDAELIKKLLSPKGVSVINQNAVEKNGLPISSTNIRLFLSEGDLASANSLLGRAFSFKSEIVHGKQLGRTLGFPTINQRYPKELVLPRFGVYAVRCRIGGRLYGGVANIGVKPTVSDENAPICETYLFDYSGDCYGCIAETEFIEFIRAEKRFASLNELKEQVERDKVSATEILSKGV